MSSEKPNVEVTGNIDQVRAWSSGMSSMMKFILQGGAVAVVCALLIIRDVQNNNFISSLQQERREEAREQRESERYKEDRYSNQLQGINEKHWKAIRELRDEIASLRQGANRPSATGTPTEGATGK